MIVLDTNILSELMRSEPAAAVFAWVSAQPRATLYTTSVSKAEILYGIAVLPEGRRRLALAPNEGRDAQSQQEESWGERRTNRPVCALPNHG